MAMGDSLIGAWDSKVNFNFWRPITAIRLGDSDGSERTVGDGSSTPDCDCSTSSNGCHIVERNQKTGDTADRATGLSGRRRRGWRM